MPDHVHDLPVCGFEQHDPHAPECDEKRMGRMIACGKVVDPKHPSFGKALCRHRKAIEPEVWVKIFIFVLVAFLLVVEIIQFEIRIIEIVTKIVVLILMLIIIRIEVRLIKPR